MTAIRRCLPLLAMLPEASTTLLPGRLRVAENGARAPVQLRERREETLLQADAVRATPKHKSLLQSGQRRLRRRKYEPADWFGNFDQGESTYTEGGVYADPRKNPLLKFRDGWNPMQNNPYVKKDVDQQFFVELPSGGPKQAWQTYWPANSATVSAGAHKQTGYWFEGTGGTWQQEYQGFTPPQFAGKLKPAWFDSSLDQLDGYGRRKYPDMDSPRRFLTWEEKSSNTTLTCAKPGCTANVSLVASFDWNTEDAKDCTLSVFFHPTDFDDEFGGEKVEWVQVNNQLVSHSCRPHLDGCNQTASRPLVPCVHHVSLDNLMPANGDLKIAAKIAHVVDECPYKKNHLSAVPMITCLVTKKQKPTTNPPIKMHGSTNNMVINGVCRVKVPLTCDTKGCKAQSYIPISAQCAALGKCSLSVNVTQTDYDNLDGTLEAIEYIQVDKKNISTNLKPGKNPCKTKWGGTNVKQPVIYNAVKEHALSNVQGGVTLDLEAKITKFVDECPWNGNLFDASAEVLCSKTGKAAFIEDDETLSLLQNVVVPNLVV